MMPFGALPMENGRQLIDEYTVSYLSAAREVLRFTEPTSARAAPPLVIAGPEYDSDASSPTGLPFRALPWAQAEGEAIAEMVHVRPLKGAAAAKSELFNCSSPSIVHIATHGFLLRREEPLSAEQMKPGVVVTASNPDRALIALDGVLATPTDFVAVTQTPFSRLSGRGLETPLLRAGIALAGANTWLGGGQLSDIAGNGIRCERPPNCPDLVPGEALRRHRVSPGELRAKRVTSDPHGG